MATTTTLEDDQMYRLPDGTHVTTMIAYSPDGCDVLGWALYTDEQLENGMQSEYEVDILTGEITFQGETTNWVITDLVCEAGA